MLFTSIQVIFIRVSDAILHILIWAVPCANIPMHNKQLAWDHGEVYSIYCMVLAEPMFFGKQTIFDVQVLICHQ